MRSSFLFLICGLFIGGCQTTSGSSVALKPGMIFENSIRVGLDPIQLALPKGKWEVGGVREYQNNVDTTIQDVFLYQQKGGKLSKAIWFKTPLELNIYGYLQSKYCSRDNMHYRKTVIDYRTGDQDCRWVNHYRITLHGNKIKMWRDAGAWLTERKIDVPAAAIDAGYRLSDGSTFIMVHYFFNPEVDGFSPPREANWNTSDWHPSNTVRDPKKVAYINRLKAWSDEYYPKVKAGFKGKLTGSPQLKPTPTITTPTTPKSSTVADRLKQLDDLLKQQLISKQEYDERRKEILKEL